MLDLAFGGSATLRSTSMPSALDTYPKFEFSNNEKMELGGPLRQAAGLKMAHFFNISNSHSKWKICFYQRNKEFLQFLEL